MTYISEADHWLKRARDKFYSGKPDRVQDGIASLLVCLDQIIHELDRRAAEGDGLRPLKKPRAKAKR